MVAANSGHFDRSSIHAHLSQACDTGCVLMHPGEAPRASAEDLSLEEDAAIKKRRGDDAPSFPSDPAETEYRGDQPFG